MECFKLDWSHIGSCIRPVCMSVNVSVSVSEVVSFFLSCNLSPYTKRLSMILITNYVVAFDGETPIARCF